MQSTSAALLEIHRQLSSPPRPVPVPYWAFGTLCDWPPADLSAPPTPCTLLTAQFPTDTLHVWFSTWDAHNPGQAPLGSPRGIRHRSCLKSSQCSWGDETGTQLQCSHLFTGTKEDTQHSARSPAVGGIRAAS